MQFNIGDIFTDGSGQIKILKKFNYQFQKSDVFNCEVLKITSNVSKFKLGEIYSFALGHPNSTWKLLNKKFKKHPLTKIFI